MLKIFLCLSVVVVGLQSTPIYWKMLQENVCFGAKNDAFGLLTHKFEGFLSAVRLEHVSGGVTCFPRLQITNFGCGTLKDKLAVFITGTTSKNILFPHTKTGAGNGFYDFYGFNSNSPDVVLSKIASPLYVKNGMQMRIWYGEDLLNSSESDNSGKSCVNVYGKFDY